jgi:MFS family permease
MNLVYALSAYPFGKLSDRMNHKTLLALGLVVLISADLVLAINTHWSVVLTGVALWGVHMGMTQGLLATMVADTAPADLRGTAYGFSILSVGWLCYSRAYWLGCCGIDLEHRLHSMQVQFFVSWHSQDCSGSQL